MSLGTGKSLLLRAIISALRKKHAKKPEVISVTASTGMAASNVGGELGLQTVYVHTLSHIYFRNDYTLMGSHHPWDD